MARAPAARVVVCTTIGRIGHFDSSTARPSADGRCGLPEADDPTRGYGSRVCDGYCLIAVCCQCPAGRINLPDAGPDYRTSVSAGIFGSRRRHGTSSEPLPWIQSGLGDMGSGRGRALWGVDWPTRTSRRARWGIPNSAAASDGRDPPTSAHPSRSTWLSFVRRTY